jgi:hypothetical protein
MTRDRGRHADFKLWVDDQSSVESDHGAVPAGTTYPGRANPTAAGDSRVRPADTITRR